MKAIKCIVYDDLFIQYDEKNYPMTMPTFHYHDIYEVYILRTGVRHIILNNLVYRTEALDAALIRPNEFHRSYGDTPYSGICLNFSDRFLDSYFTPKAKQQLISCFENPIISLNEQALEEILLLSRKIDSEPSQNFIYMVHILEILHTFSKQMDSGRKLAIDPALSPVTKYISDHFMELQTLEEIAKQLYMTKYHLCHVFKKQTGMTVISYINTLRIQQACLFLHDTLDPIDQISVKCGFQSPSYFNRVFKKLMGCTPKEFRNAQKSNTGKPAAKLLLTQIDTIE